MPNALTLFALLWLTPCIALSQVDKQAGFAKERADAKTFYRECVRIYGPATANPDPDAALSSNENNSYCLTQYRTMVADIEAREKEWQRTSHKTSSTTSVTPTTPATRVTSAGAGATYTTSAGRGAWITRDITIFHKDIFNAVLHSYDVMAFTCDDNGKPWHNGLCVCIQNNSRDTLFYRTNVHAQGSYVPVKDRKVINWTPANVLTFYPIYPGQRTVLCFDGYLSNKDRTLAFDMTAEFRLFQENKTTKTKRNDPPPPVVNQTLPEPAAPGKISNGSSTFYVILQANISLPNGKGAFDALKSPAMEIDFSTPQKHTGLPDDDYSTLKETFVQRIVTHYRGTDLGFDPGKTLRENNYEGIRVSITPPYESRLLRTPEEARQATDRWKEMLQRTLAGASRLSFIQIEME